MTKILRKTFAFLIGLFAFLGAGFLFAGCGVNYSKISLVADVDGAIELNVGEQADITFKILGYQKGFSNQIKIDCKNDGQTKIFEEISKEYISNSEIKVTIQATAGGVGQIYAKTLEAGKECYVDISVSQTSSSMQRENNLLYVSNSTPFIPDSGLFKFDANTTNKDVDFYFLQKTVASQNVDFSTYEISEFDFDGANPYALFVDSVQSWSINLSKFNKISLSEELKLVLDDNTTSFDLSDKFDILSVYRPSVGSEKLVYCVSSVNVLPDISASVYGKYFDEDDFEAVSLENPIVIVPNNASKREYLLKIEVESAPVGSPIKIGKTSLNNYIDIDFLNVSTENDKYLNDNEYKALVDALLEGEESGKTYYYLKISQNARTQVTTHFSLNVFYDIAQGMGDESINFVADMTAEIKIAPTAVLINGTQSPDRLTLYNYYRYPEFGWNELDVSVVSGMDETPNIEGVYFEFDDARLEITYQGIIIKAGESNLYTELTDSFYIRGKQGIPESEGLEVKVYVKSNVVEETLDPATLICDIVAGATRISKNVDTEVFYLDILDGRNQEFDHQIFADQVFQYITYKKVGGQDVVDIALTNDVYKTYIGEDGKYFLDIILSPKAEGVGVYRIYLDNGMSIDLTFSVVGTLKSETTFIDIYDSDTKVSFSSSKSAGADYVDTFEYELLNPSDNQSVSIGNTLNLAINANINASGGIEIVGEYEGIISTGISGNIINIHTQKNGNAKFKVVLSGSRVKKTSGKVDFVLESTELVYYIKIYSYSRASEFYLLNGGTLAIDNTVYYSINSSNDSLLREEDKTVVFDTYVKNDDINNFYKYDFVPSALEDIFENSVESGDNLAYVVKENQIAREMVYEKYDKRFVYFLVEGKTPSIRVDITKTTVGNPISTSKSIYLSIKNGLMFNPSDEIVYNVYDDEGNVIATYKAEFSDKIFSMSKTGNFNIATLSYTDTVNQSYTIRLNAYLSQRDQTKTYTAKITSKEYLQTEAISLSSNITALDFQHDILSYDLGVYTFPTYATNKDISIDFVTTNGSRYTDFLTPGDFVVGKLGNGSFTLRISCQNFVNNFATKYGMNIIEAEDIISGRIYIYPSDWGTNYSLISGARVPICIDVSFRNGSRKNPYIISSAEDLININADEQKLQSHYEVRTNIDLSGVKNFVPIGIINEKIVGFGGTITGTTSLAGFSNITITKDNFSKVLDNSLYSGIFAQLNGPTKKTIAGAETLLYQTAQIENLLISGNIQLEISGVNSANVGLLTSINKGNIVNVEVDLQNSTISGSSLTDLSYGALAGINTGRILQDFRAYEGRKSQDGKYFEVYDISQVYKKDDNYLYAYREGSEVKFKYVDEYGYGIEVEDDGGVDIPKKDVNGNFIRLQPSSEKVYTGIYDFVGQTPRKLSNYFDKLTISGSITNVYAGGVAGYGNGVIERILPENENFKLLGYMAYSAISEINVVSTSSNINLGGIIGKYVLDDVFADFGLKLQNLLVGGEISSFDATLGTGLDNVGGVAGTIDTVGQAIVYVLSNKVRAFVRAQNYAGAIVGGETYPSKGSAYSTDCVDYADGNIIEAIDDGRGMFFSSQVITGKEGQDTNYKEVSNPIRVAIGNATDKTTNNRDYESDMVPDFILVSYSERSCLAIPEGGAIANLSDLTRVNTYGDRILVNRDGSVKVMSKIDYPRQSVSIDSIQPTDNSARLEYVDGTKTHYAYVMYYFALTGTLISGDGSSLQEVMDKLNVVSPQSDFYPFSLNNVDVVLNVSSSNILSVDPNGNISVKTTGLSAVVLSSILNINKTQNINIYVFNYFNHDIESSIFYAGKNVDSLNISNNSTVLVYGDSTASVNVIPSYYLEEASTTNGGSDVFSITKDGKLSYQNKTYYLAKNADISAEIETPDSNYFSYAQTNKQTITFSKNKETTNGDIDSYKLIPLLAKTIKLNGEDKTFKMNFKNASNIDINVEYREVATFIASGEDNYSIDTNGYFEDEIKVISTNTSEFVFYQITKTIDGVDYIVQERLPDQATLQSLTDDEKYLDYIKTREITNSDYVFKFNIERGLATNFFVMNVSVDKDSEAFKNRAQNDIYGEYKVHLYASQLEEGINYTFTIWLSEAQVNYLVMKNYSDLNNISLDDKKIVPSQQGLLEIVVEPSEAIFERFEIENDSINSLAGANRANFTFAYEEVTTSGNVKFVLSPNFGIFEDGKLSFSYDEMMQFYTDKGEKYNGKIYIAYILPSTNVENNVEIKFNAKVIFDNGAQEEKTTTILTTKLSNFVKLSFANRKLLDGNYYVARGLEYDLDLSLYGYNENQIEFTYSNSYVSVEKQNGRYMLVVTSDSIPYSNSAGFWTDVSVTARKEVDGVMVAARSTLSFYIMEYVLNYSYVEGEFEDLVERVNNGVLSTSIGNPVELKFAISQMLEYDRTNETIRSEVDFFANNMTNGITWKVWKDGVGTQIGDSVSIKNDYYLIDGLVVTPIRLYNPESDIYHFSVQGNYKIAGGIYTYDPIATDSNLIYTEFAFEVHDQSTEDSPIPIRNYEEFAGMNVGEWYILLDNIVLPSSEYASSYGVEQFVPFDKQLAGFDGNGYSLIFNGTYNFEDENEIGVFSRVYEGEILKNVKIKIEGNTTFNVSSQTFKVGLLTSTNSGIITNCQTECGQDKVFSVTSTVATTDSYVAGLVAENTSGGIITNSRSKVTIYAYENIGGFVGKNAGHIASSYFVGAIKNQSTTSTERTAGFVVENSGKIFTSYVSGVPVANSVYYGGENGDANVIQSSGNVAGFVFTNDDEDAMIADCYSNILLKQSGAFASGFVYENSGNIERCFSTSVLDNNQNSNYGFVRTNRTSKGDGQISNCFFLQDTNINTNISIVDGVDVKPLSIDDFSEMNNFSEFAYTSGRRTNSVWFFNNEPGRSENFGGQIFNTKRLELVAPNIIAQSRRNLASVNEIEDGDATYVTYSYTFDSSYPALGSMQNPILIASAEDMENYISDETSSVGYNYCAYRLISNIDYTTYQSNSMLYKTKFLGYLEGNFLSIKGASLTSSQVLENAGLFGQVGSSNIAGADGSLLNFTFTPKIVSFANTMTVGALTGTLDGGSVINVEVLLDTAEKLVVTGYNIVGGAIGLTKGNFVIENLYSELSAKTRNSASRDADNIDELGGQYQFCSYAGSVVGALSGTGKIKSTIINRENSTQSNISVMGRKVGLAFGYIGQDVVVTKVVINVTSNMIINAFAYGGFLAGQSKGKIENVKINSLTTKFENFRKVPNIANAIGGLVGLVSGGTIKDVDMNQSFSVSSQGANAGIESVGGLVGEIESICKISDINVQANITGYQYVGGLVGSILKGSGNVDFEDISFNGNLDATGLSVSEIGAGGLAGRVEDGAIISISKDSQEFNSFTSTITVQVYVYGTSANIYLGGIIGLDKANGNHSIAYTNAVTTFGGFVFDLASSSDIVNVEVDKNKTIRPTSTPLASITDRSATGSTYEMSGQMQMSNSEGSKAKHLYILNFGENAYVSPTP